MPTKSSCVFFLFHALLVGGVVFVAGLPGCKCSKEETPEESVPAAMPAPEPAPVEPSAAPVKRDGKLPLWKIVSPTASVHLLGSVRVSSRSFYPLPDKVEKPFAEADALVLERPADKLSEEAATKKLLGAAAFVPPESLTAHITPATRDLLGRYLLAQSAGASVYDGLQPWFVGTLISLGELNKNAYTRDLDMDVYFYNKAAASKKPVELLETIADQVAFFESFPFETQDLMLRESLESVGTAVERASGAQDAWNAGNVVALDWLLMGSFRKPEYKPLIAKLFLERNAKIAARIDEYLKTKNRYFIVVSASNLLGEQGVLDLVAQKKHAVEQQ